ncbi:MAG: insulinase family protein [Bacteroidia bacterium]|nr:insulinase family protein [Bacteroidia bacterium]
MKQLLRQLVVGAALCCFGLQPSFAQAMQFPPLPVDKNVRIGTLPNGLTYYIRHNALPEKRVEFHIAQKVGAILEEPQQRGLAHFLEHMAFNGTKNFPGDERGLGIVPWCETKGIKFGANLNAYTGVEQTVYQISNAPADNQNVVDSCLLILHDWSSAILLADKEIDKERGVIREEWRSRNSGMLRVITNALPVIYPNEKYADCMPIGSIDVINNFPYKDIREYYAKWYRTDLQGIIIVGDINVDAMEAKLKATFADVKAPVNPAKRTYFPVGDNDEPIVFIGKDKEVETPSISIFFKQEATPDSMKNNVGYLATQYMVNMATSMLNSRFNELKQMATPPFNSAYAGYGNYFVAKTKEAFSVEAETKAEGIELGMKTLLQELERVRRFGFTATEYERARANYLQHLESAYNEREKTKHITFVEEYISNFLDKEPIPGIETEYAMMNQIAPNIPIQAINEIIKQLITEKNQVVLIGGPDKENVAYPTKEEVIQAMKGMQTLDVKAYEDKVSNEPLITANLTGGKIVSEKAGEAFGTTKLVLSNGITVYVKQTDFKADEIIMKGTSLGGTSLFGDKEALNISQLNAVAPVGGLGNFSKVDLTKALAGKRANVSTGIGNTTENVNGSCAPKDLETMLQLTYLSFTAPRKDAEAFASYKNRLKAQLEGAEANPMSAFGDTVTRTLYGNHPRAILMKANMVDQINYDRIVEMYKERYKNAGDFTFYFIGNIDLATAKPMIAKYLGSLPATKTKETFKDTKLEIRKGAFDNVFAKKQETPMATILFTYSGTCKYDLKNNVLMNFLTQAMDMIYTEEIREKEGGTYGVSCFGNVNKYPKESFTLQVFFQTDPAKTEKLSQVVREQLQRVAKEGPSAEQLQKIKEYMLKKHNDNQKENGYWLKNLDEYFYTGLDYTKGYEALINSITLKDIQAFANQILQQKNEIKVVMTAPEDSSK